MISEGYSVDVTCLVKQPTYFFKISNKAEAKGGFENMQKVEGREKIEEQKAKLQNDYITLKMAKETSK